MAHPKPRGPCAPTKAATEETIYRRTLEMAELKFGAVTQRLNMRQSCALAGSAADRGSYLKMRDDLGGEVDGAIDGLRGNLKLPKELEQREQLATCAPLRL